jgi:DNA-directed RNA polymerase specialized sigma subunit
MIALPEEKRFSAIAILQHGRSTCEVSKLLGISQSTCSRIRRECVPHVEPSRGGAQEALPLLNDERV